MIFEHMKTYMFVIQIYLCRDFSLVLMMKTRVVSLEMKVRDNHLNDYLEAGEKGRLHMMIKMSYLLDSVKDLEKVI